MFGVVAALFFVTSVAALADDCAKKLGGKWELQGDSKIIADRIKAFGAQTMTIDAGKKVTSMKMGEKEFDPKPYEIVSCNAKEVVIRADKDSGKKLTLRFTFKDADTFVLTPVDYPKDRPEPTPQTFKKAAAE
ncbi:MAG: hypothetical protein M5R36_18710 [Deltaproteobacteria bacterium]|nr:hypothetical protein [Deltaproteobacteria bacterium]